ncbi:MAG: hypothetical protein U0T82_17400 [Bacteroidales bacterium]
MRYLLCIFVVGLFFSCAKEDELPLLKSSEDLLIGHWSKQEFRDTVEVYTRVASLPENEYGFSLYPDGKLVEHKNSGWCGTPPVSYADFDGTWKYENDTVIAIVAGYWGGTMRCRMQVLKKESNKLELRRFDFEFPENPLGYILLPIN